MESQPADDPNNPLAAVASLFPLLVYDHGDPPVYYQTVLSAADESMRTFQVPEMCNYTCLETPQGSGGGTCWPRWAVAPPGPNKIPGINATPKKRHIHSMAAVRGKFYFQESPNVLGVFSFAQSPEPHMELAKLDAITPRFISDAPQTATLSYLLESCQDLFLVCLFYRGCNFERLEEIGAYRMDFSSQEWCKVTDIGDRAFLLGSENFAASCSATEHGLKKGCVYFANDILGDSNDLHIFDVKEGTRELATPTQDIPVLTRKPFWMVPVVQ